MARYSGARTTVLALLLSVMAHPVPADENRIAVNLGRFVNLNCNLLAPEARHELEWRVAASNRRDADGPGGATLAADEQKARALSATPEFADCGTNAAEAVTRAQLILENRDTDDGGETYLGDVSYRHLMSERLAQILTALDVQRKCTDNPAGQQSIANVRAEALRLFDRAYGSGASSDGAEMSKWDLILNPNRPCGPASQTAVAGADQSLAELRILLHQDMNLIARREMVPVNLWRMTDYRTYHPFHKVSLAIEPNGQLAVGTLPPYTEGRLLFDKFAGSTLDATREKKAWSGAPSLTALIPRRTITPLGTVYRKPVDGNWAAYDEGPAQNLGEAEITEAVPAAAFTAMMLGRSLLGLLDRDDEAMRQFKRHLSTQDSTELAAHAINVLAVGIEIVLLPSDSSRQLIPLVQQQSFLDDSAFYLVMDRIVRARKVAYLLSPAQLRGGLDKPLFDRAVKNNPNVSMVKGAYVITRTWQDPRIIAVGYSILGVTAAGKDRMVLPSPTATAEAFIVQSQDATGQIVRN